MKYRPTSQTYYKNYWTSISLSLQKLFARFISNTKLLRSRRLIPVNARSVSSKKYIYLTKYLHWSVVWISHSSDSSVSPNVDHKTSAITRNSTKLLHQKIDWFWSHIYIKHSHTSQAYTDLMCVRHTHISCV